MTNLTGDIHIDRPRQKVWDILADLGSVSVWNPAVASSFSTSAAKQGVGAGRHCDFPDGGYVKERATEWRPGEAFRLEIHEGTIPFGKAYGTYTLKDDGQGTRVSFTLEYDLKSDAPVDPLEVERQNREELIPTVLAGLKHYVETGKPMPVPAPSSR